MARVNSRSWFFPCSETKQKSLLRRLMPHEIHNYLFFFGRWAVLALKLWPSVSITVITWWLFFIGLPVRATLNQEIPLVHVEKRPNGRNGISRKLFMSLFPWGRFLGGGDASFQVVWRTDLEVDLERTQNYFVELLALFFWLRRIII